MFKIDNTMAIKISQGDNADFPLFLNKGKMDAPIRYEMSALSSDEVYFYVFRLNDTKLDSPILYKKIKTNGTVIGYVDGILTYTKEEMDIINENKDLVIKLYPEDTVNIEPTQYKFQIKAKLGGKIYTVTNKLNFYIMNDDYSSRIWE